MAFKTEFPFTLPKGFIDSEGKLHRTGVMRLATAKDEIVPLQDYRVQNNRAYLVIVLLSRVITKLGELSMVDTEVIENLFSTDLAYLQEFYRRINEEGAPRIHAKCPSCQHEFDIDLLGGGDGRVVGQGG
ncbi:MAG TPA: phage tail assembly protein [Pseudomonadota bacterium]|nr:phage tail assembly protein [Pseudomonadota bacterium]